MTFIASPPWIDPTVTTVGTNGFVSRETIVCSSMTIFAAHETGSMARCGSAPWPPFPLTVISNAPAAARRTPGLLITMPVVAPGHTCNPKICSTSGECRTPSSHIRSAPAPPSSAGWKISFTTPAQFRFTRLQQPRGAEQHRRMTVMAACVHLAVDLAPKRHVGFFVDWQRVHVGAQRDAGSRSAADRRDDTVFATVSADRECPDHRAWPAPAGWSRFLPYINSG
jgi:hypothetical protein